MSYEEKERTLRTGQAFLYSIAAFGLMLPISIAGGFSYYYMVYVIGIRPILASIGNSLGLFLTAFMAPIAGYLSDKKKPSKLGRRRPFLLIGAPIMAIAFFFIWYYPEWLSIDTIGEIGVTLIFWTSISIFSLYNTYVFAPYQAMLPEISTIEENRIKIAGMQGIFNLIGTVFGVLFPFLIKGLVNSNSELIFWMQIIAFITSIFSVITIYMTFFGIHEPIEEICKDNEIKIEECESKNGNIISIFKDMFSPLKNDTFRKFQINNFIFNFAIRIPMTILLPFLEVVLLIKEEELISFMLIIIPFAGLGFYLCTKLSVQKGLIKTLKIIYIIMIGAFFSALIFIIPMSKNLRYYIGLFIIIIIVMFLVGIFILPNPINSKIIDEEIQNVIKKNGPFKNVDDKYKFAGKFFGVHSFLLNLAGAIAFLLLGALMESNEKNPVVLSLMLPITGFFCLFALYFLNKVKFKNTK